MKIPDVNKTRTVFLLAGIIILVLLFKSFGTEKFINNILALNWKFLIIISLFLFNNIFLTFAWKILINHTLSWKKFYKLFLARIAGDLFSSINLMGAVAGEPIKAMFMKDEIPFKTGLASVVLDRTIHTLANTLLLLTGIISSFFILQIELIYTVGIFIFALTLLCVIIAVLKKQKEGFIEFLISKIPNTISSRFIDEKKIIKIREIDEEIGFILSSKENLKKFYMSLITRYISVLVTGTMEIYLIINFVGVNIAVTNSMFVYIFTLFLTSIVFFMPANIGTSEASYSLALKFLGYDPALGLTVGIIRRLRTFAWSGIGMLIVFYGGLFRKENIKK